MSVYANAFAKKDGKFRAHLIAHGDVCPKSDAFLFEYNGHFWLEDGGLTQVDAVLTYLMKYRAELLAEHPELVGEESCRLKLDWIVSHFHNDHVCATIEFVMPSPFIELETIYLPPDSALDRKYDTANRDGDVLHRPSFLDAREKYQKQARIVDIGFGTENIFEKKFGELEMTIYPPVRDGGLGEPLRVIIDGYYDGDEKHKMIPVAAVNSCSMWLKFRLGKHSFLFTGDTMKKTPDLFEAADDMVETYLDKIGKVTVLKHLHHGVNRDHAVPLMVKFEPEYLLLTTQTATADAELKKEFPESAITLVNCWKNDFIFETDGERLTLEKKF